MLQSFPGQTAADYDGVKRVYPLTEIIITSESSAAAKGSHESVIAGCYNDDRILSLKAVHQRTCLIVPKPSEFIAMAIFKTVFLAILAARASAQSVSPGLGSNPNAEGATDNVTRSAGPNG